MPRYNWMSHDVLPPDSAFSDTIVQAIVSLAFLLSAVWGLAIIILVAKGKAGAIRDRIRRDQKTGAPWMHYAFSVTGAIGNLLVLALASFKWWQGAGTFQQCLYDIPLWWLPATLLIISLLVLWMENLINA